MPTKSKPHIGETQAAGNGHTPVIKVAGYARVSSQKQKRQETVKTQVEQITRCCESQGWHLDKIYADEARSGTLRFDHRPEARQLLADARQGKFSMVIVADFDRLGREGEVSYVTKNLLTGLGLSIYEIATGTVVSALSGGLVFGIRTALAEEGRRQFLERSHAGRLRVVREGRWVGGRPPFGYKIVHHQLAIDEREAPTVRKIFTLAAHRCSTVALAKRLNDEGSHPRLGGLWRFNHVARLLHMTVYRGQYQWGRKEHVTLTVPPLISEELWIEAQEALRLNSKANKGNSKRDYLLKSLILCGLCGGRHMTGCFDTSRGRRKYRCNAKLKASLSPTCPGSYVDADQIEALVWNQLADWISRKEDIEETLTEQMRSYEDERQTWSNALAQARADLERTDPERQTILRLRRKGAISETDMERQLAEIEHEQGILMRTIAELEQRTLDEDIARIAANIREQLEQFRSAIRKGTVSAKTQRRIIENHVESVAVHLPKGVKPQWTVREVLPFHPGITSDVPAGKRTTLWARDGETTQEPEARVVVCYRFPWPSLNTALDGRVINSHSHARG